MESKLTIRLRWDGERVTDVEIRSTRPFQASRVLLGRAPQAAVDMVPRMFSVCGRAQGVAAVMAAEAALGRQVPPSLLRLRRRLVVAEAIQEYLWRIFLDWPQWLGETPAPQRLAPLRSRVSALLRETQQRAGACVIGADEASEGDAPWPEIASLIDGFLATEVYGCSPADWLGLADTAAFSSWAAGTDTTAARTLAALSADTAASSDLAIGTIGYVPHPAAAWVERELLAAMRAEPRFAATPTWRGAALETGAPARVADHPLLRGLGGGLVRRLAARLIELTRLARALDETADDWATGLAVGAGEGLACVETARGLLIHRLAIAGDRVTDYQIVAPTEWNFHPGGALAQELTGARVASAEAATRLAGRLVQALDPCVAYEIEVQRGCEAS